MTCLSPHRPRQSPSFHASSVSSPSTRPSTASLARCLLTGHSRSTGRSPICGALSLPCTVWAPCPPPPPCQPPQLGIRATLLQLLSLLPPGKGGRRSRCGQGLSA